MKTKREFGGIKRPKDAALAAEVLALIEQAYQTLNNAEKRREYRRSTFNMVWPHQATMLVEQAKLAIYRKDIGEAKNLLSAAEDMSPSPEAAQLLNGILRG